MTTTAPPVELQAIEKLREEELEEARSIQSAMLPAEPLRAGKVKISYAFQPIAEGGGDFLDYFALAVGPLRGVHKTGMPRGDVLSTLNRRLLIRGMPRRHAAVQYAVFDPRSREMRIASAGMPWPLHISPRGCRSVEITGIPPGLWAPTVTYETSRIAIKYGDFVLFCPDGITDAFNKEDES